MCPEVMSEGFHLLPGGMGDGPGACTRLAGSGTCGSAVLRALGDALQMAARRNMLKAM